jgi:hypothetical protein
MAVAHTELTESPQPVQSVAAFFVVLGRQVRIAIHTVGDLIEPRFAEFAALPHQSPVSRQQWEALWETEAES